MTAPRTGPKAGPGAGRGFSLIELMVVVTVVAILAAVAYPSYTESVRKGKRASAKAKMTEVAGRLQQFYSEQSSAATFTTDLTALKYGASLTSEAKAHTITVEAGPDGIASTYKIIATPAAGHADPKCPALTLNSLGAFLPAGC